MHLSALVFVLEIPHGFSDPLPAIYISFTGNISESFSSSCTISITSFAAARSVHSFPRR